MGSDRLDLAKFFQGLACQIALILGLGFWVWGWGLRVQSGLRVLGFLTQDTAVRGFYRLRAVRLFFGLEVLGDCPNFGRLLQQTRVSGFRVLVSGSPKKL